MPNIVGAAVVFGRVLYCLEDKLIRQAVGRAFGGVAATSFVYICMPPTTIMLLSCTTVAWEEINTSRVLGVAGARDTSCNEQLFKSLSMVRTTISLRASRWLGEVPSKITPPITAMMYSESVLMPVAE